jgi:hypothetical protein
MYMYVYVDVYVCVCLYICLCAHLSKLDGFSVTVVSQWCHSGVTMVLQYVFHLEVPS